MDRLARLRLEGSAAGEWDDYDGTRAVSGLGSGDSALLVGLPLPHRLRTQPQTAAAALTAELQAAFSAGSSGMQAEFDPRYAGSAGYAAAIVTSVSADGQFPLYRYPASGGTAPLVEAQLDWSAAPLIDGVRAAADAAADTRSNHAVVNYFHDGNAVLGAHSDKTLDLVPDAPTVVVSIGATRTLVLTPHGTGRPQRLRLRHGSVVVLGPETNRAYTHEVVAEQHDTGPRLSVTLRAVRTQTKHGRPAVGLGAAFGGLNYPTELLDVATGNPLPKTGLALSGSSTLLLLYVRLTLKEARSGGSLRQVFDGMATAERPGGPGTPGGTKAYSLWKDNAEANVWHKLEIFANAEASNSVSAPPNNGWLRTQSIFLAGQDTESCPSELVTRVFPYSLVKALPCPVVGLGICRCLPTQRCPLESKPPARLSFRLSKQAMLCALSVQSISVAQTRICILHICFTQTFHISIVRAGTGSVRAICSRQRFTASATQRRSAGARWEEKSRKRWRVRLNAVGRRRTRLC